MENFVSQYNTNNEHATIYGKKNCNKENILLQMEVL